MNPETIGTLSALALGLFGSSHCIGMCGGISGAFGLANPAQQVNKNLALAVSFNLGRILSYALIGFIFGLFGALASDQFTAISNIMRIVAAALLVLMGLYVAGINSTVTVVEKLGKGVWRRLQPLTRRFIPVTSNTSALCLGGLWGWLPCGLVYSTLIWAVSSGSAGQSAWLMFCFGLGTLPAMISTTFFAQSVKHWLQKKWLRVIAGIIIIAMGGLTLSHALMDHSGMDHGTMDHSKMDHSKMDHQSMDHSSMQH
ncbi:hypothetical protein SIN8267_00933 [Sinobacterium norvegicum]|uniref:Urease accessory protein UreH-like transmembrane domain-containing protein n=1 Tax=Sinobacterium norvegicum TaxID=1641715 RepID=A0ABM9ACA7_9GAMM|nr:sulfite exporter TauE/SafE family protein [Sinobacterium norvegicum]CAH0990833.1 hypothetical protein SIN8267_00933 [Sinobacterium norvegicum]